jgi:hypothetical protein
LTQGNPTSVLIQYLAPLFLVVAAVAAAGWIERRFSAPGAGIAFAAALLTISIAGSAVNARDYPRVYNADMLTLATLEKQLGAQPKPASAEHTIRLVVAGQPPYLRSYDLHNNIAYMNADSKLSAFLFNYVSRAMLVWRSTLEPSTDLQEIQICVDMCNQRAATTGEKQPFLILPMEPTGTHCLCP